MAVRSDDHRHTREPPGEQEGLVPGIVWIEPDAGGVGDHLDPAAPATVAPADDGGLPAERGQRQRGQLGGGRLSRSSQGEVADGHDQGPERARAQHAAPVQPFPCAQETAVSRLHHGHHARGGAGKSVLPALQHAPHGRAAGAHAPGLVVAPEAAPGRRNRDTSSSVSRTAP